jgi:hypothetical protein
VTWYPQDFVKVPMTDMRMRAEPSSGYPGRTYRFYEGEKVFEFGYGLSYSKYVYELPAVTQSMLHLNQSIATETAESRLVSELGKEVCERKKISVNFHIKNEGEMAGKHSVLLFLRREKPSHGSPVKQLVGFQSLNLKAGERAEVEFVLNPCEHLSRANEAGLMMIEPGSHFLVVGDVELPLTIII